MESTCSGSTRVLHLFYEYYGLDFVSRMTWRLFARLQSTLVVHTSQMSVAADRRFWDERLVSHWSTIDETHSWRTRARVSHRSFSQESDNGPYDSWIRNCFCYVGVQAGESASRDSHALKMCRSNMPFFWKSRSTLCAFIQHAISP